MNHLAWTAGTSNRGGRRARMSRAMVAMPSSLLPEDSELLLLLLLLLLATDELCSSIIDSKNTAACALLDVSAALSCSPNSAGGSMDGN